MFLQVSVCPQGGCAWLWGGHAWQPGGMHGSWGGCMAARGVCSFLPPANEVWGKVIFSEGCVKNSVCRGGLPQCMLGYHTPWSRHPPGAGTPLAADPPAADPPPGAGTPQSRHPPPSRACWEIQPTSGQYTSYWNAILFYLFLRLCAFCFTS